jgi:hypothetical protein
MRRSLSKSLCCHHVTGELGYLALAQPDGVSLQAHIERHLAIGSLEQDDLIERLLLQRGFCGEGH